MKLGNMIFLQTNLNPVTKPSSRGYHSMVFIGNNKIILFGGLGSGTYNDETWEYDISSNTWTNLNPVIKPSVRAGHAMTFIGNNKIILFGGSSSSSNYYNDTWEYDISSNTWTDLNPVTKPSARGYHSMVFIGINKIILFGGWDGIYTAETWEYDISTNTWTNLNPSISPSGRTSHSMVYTENNKIILFGGLISGGIQNDETWEYDISSNTWIDLNPLNKPSERDAHYMSYIGNNIIILFGGRNTGGTLNDTWKYIK